MKYENFFDNYISTHDITSDNLDDLNYTEFFNEITTECLGKPPSKYKSSHQTAYVLVYLPDAVKEKVVECFDSIYVSSLYLGIITHGSITFNYPNYIEFLQQLIDLRLDIKSRISSDPKNERLNLKNILIKSYMNVLYGMINKEGSVLTSDKENVREYIVKNATKVMLTIASYYLNKSKPIYYIDVDEMYVPHLTGDEFVELQQHFDKECSQYINTDFSNIYIDNEGTPLCTYITGKKKMITSHCDTTKIKGMAACIDAQVLRQNKMYFGRNYRDIFPEYAI